MPVCLAALLIVMCCSGSSALPRTSWPAERADDVNRSMALWVPGDVSALRDLPGEELEVRIGEAVLWDCSVSVPVGDGIYEVTAVRFALPGLPGRVELSVAWRLSASRRDETVTGVAQWDRVFRLVDWWGCVAELLAGVQSWKSGH